IEDVVNSLLLEHHLNRPTIIQKLLFDSRVSGLFADCFDGVFGSHSEKEKKGSHLFWALPTGHGRGLQLQRRGGELVSEDGSYRLPLSPDGVQRALLKGELIPGLTLTFTVLAFYYGVTCIGGMHQTSYLGDMKAAYLRFLDALG